ncbi:MAG: hypothetical protein RR263_03115, partial [Oscillospiraceae bacterium]
KEKTAKGFDAAAKGIGNVANNIKEKTKNFHGVNWLGRFVNWVFGTACKMCKFLFVAVVAVIILCLLAMFLLFLATSIITFFT